MDHKWAEKPDLDTIAQKIIAIGSKAVRRGRFLGSSQNGSFGVVDVGNMGCRTNNYDPELFKANFRTRMICLPIKFKLLDFEDRQETILTE